MNQLQIETYIEAQEAPKDEKEITNYNEKLIDLGLDHLVIRDTNISPIAPMSDLEKAVYERLCPKQIKLEKYPHPIPMRVLEAYSKCKSYLEDFANEKNVNLDVMIWVDKDPDPIMIAKASYHESFLIGRWGSELQDFPTLLKRAKEMILSESTSRVEEARSIVKLFDEDRDSFAMGRLIGNISSIYF